MKTKPTLSRKLAAWRRRCGLTQLAAAEKLGCPLQTLQQWEHGRRTPRGFALAALLERLK